MQYPHLIKLQDVLVKHHWKIATAESCTGGMLSSLMTSVPGSSEWFERGFVTYSNLAKEEMLGVSKESLSLHGAVSEAVAREMAVGALQHSQANVSVAITGIAGPAGGSPEKPIGLVWFGFAKKDDVETAQQHFKGDRNAVREQAVCFVLEKLLDFL